MLKINEEFVRCKYKGFEHYLVGNYGTVLNTKPKKLRTLQGSHSRSGELWVMLHSVDKRKKAISICRLVCDHFVEPLTDDDIAIHIDGDMENNYYKNTAKGNARVRTLTAMAVGNHPGRPTYRNPTIVTDLTTGITTKYRSMKSASLAMGQHASYVCENIKHGVYQNKKYAWAKSEPINE